MVGCTDGLSFLCRSLMAILGGLLLVLSRKLIRLHFSFSFSFLLGRCMFRSYLFELPLQLCLASFLMLYVHFSFSLNS